MFILVLLIVLTLCCIEQYRLVIDIKRIIQDAVTFHLLYRIICNPYTIIASLHVFSRIAIHKNTRTCQTMET